VISPIVARCAAACPSQMERGSGRGAARLEIIVAEIQQNKPCPARETVLASALLERGGYKIAGWSSQVARQAHNLKVVGSNPTPVTNESPKSQ
jgi:hypothetical protein